MRSTTITCPYCGAISHMTLVGNSVCRPLGLAGYRWQAAFECDACKELVSAACNRDGMISSVRADQEFWDEQVGIQWRPARIQGRVFEHVPEHIATAASEAYLCHSIDAYRGAAALSRAVVEATAKEKGITKGTLQVKIDEMCSQGLLRAHVMEAAHEVRHLGNEMAHGDFTDPVSSAESELVLTLMAEVLEEVFISPARVSAAREAREARRAGIGSTG